MPETLMKETLTELTAISPIDGRYRSKVEKLEKYFSEAALIHYRIKMEIEYLIFMSEYPGISLRSFADEEKELLRDIYKTSWAKASAIKEHEAITNHDVKSVEYFIKDEITGTSLEDVKEWIHFATTSEDTNNIAYTLMLSDALAKELIPNLEKLNSKINDFAHEYAQTAIMARTHGQAASPSTFGKEFKLFSHRISREIAKLKELKLTAKLNGATGNYNAHLAAFPDLDCFDFTKKFIDQLNQNQSQKIEANLITSQIESHDTIAELFNIIERVNTVLIGFNQDIWRYISDSWLTQKVNEKEVGSSTMPHKVNPIDFENSEGNLGLANALLHFFSSKLQISRLQRDLSDSTVMRNIGLAFAYSIIAYKSSLKGLNKLSVNESVTEKALIENTQVIAEAIQTVLRRENFPVPYEALKALSRGRTLTQNDFIQFIDSLEVNDLIKTELKKFTALNYIGIASKIANL